MLFYIFQLVSESTTGEVYAMKKMRKAMVTSTQIREERDIMASRRSDWITSLQYAFQVCCFLSSPHLPVLLRVVVCVPFAFVQDYSCLLQLFVLNGV